MLCKDCHGTGEYWTEWGNAEITDIVIVPPTDDPFALIVCQRCHGSKVDPDFQEEN